MRLRACACWLIMTPELVERVDAWLRDHAAPFWLAFDWQGARDILVYRRSKCGAEGEAARASTAAVMRGILLTLVRWAWDDGTLHAEPHPSGAWGIYTLMSEHGIGGARTLLIPSGSSEDEALVAALEAAPRPPQIGGAS
jgi:hypothetical protein